MRELSTNMAKLTISGDALITSAISNDFFDCGTIQLSYSELVMTGGTVQNTATGANAAAIWNSTIQIGGTQSGGMISISGGTVSAAGAGAAIINRNGTINISGVKVSATWEGTAMSSHSGEISISGGTVSAIGGSAIEDFASSSFQPGGGVITISEAHPGTPTLISSASATQGTIRLNHPMGSAGGFLTINSGRVENTAYPGNADARAIIADANSTVTIEPDAEVVPQYPYP